MDGAIANDEILGVTVTDIRLRKQLVPAAGVGS